MANAITTLLAAALAWFGVVAIAAFGGAAVYGIFRQLAGHAPARARAAVLLLYGVLPLLAGTLVVCLLNFSALYAWLPPAHCHAGDCGPHAPEFAASAAQAAVASAAMLLLLVLLLWLPMQQLGRGLRRSRLARQLGRTAAPACGQARYRVIDSAEPMAWCDGLWQPTVYVSSGLLDRLSAAELAIVLAHEDAHARRRDNLARLLLHWATRFWPRRVRRRLYRDFTTAAEQACDAMAAQARGGLERVARVIEKLGVAGGGARVERSAHWHAATTNARLAALRERGAGSSPAALAPWAALVVLWLTESYVLTRAAHPVLEWLGR